MIEKIILVIAGILLCVNAVHMFYSMFAAKSKLDFVGHLFAGTFIGLFGIFAFLSLNGKTDYTISKKTNEAVVAIDTTETEFEFGVPDVQELLEDTATVSDTVRRDTIYLNRYNQNPYILILK